MYIYTCMCRYAHQSFTSIWNAHHSAENKTCTVLLVSVVWFFVIQHFDLYGSNVYTYMYTVLIATAYCSTFLEACYLRGTILNTVDFVWGPLVFGLPGEFKWEKGSTSSQKVSWFFLQMASAPGVHLTATCRLYDFLMTVSTLHSDCAMMQLPLSGGKQGNSR